MTSSTAAPADTPEPAPGAGPTRVRSPAPARPLVERLFPLGVTLLLALGYLLRVRAFAFERAFWADEAMLALGIVSKGLGDFFTPLPWDQAAPPGFVALVRLATALFGESERAMRGVSLFAGIVSLPLFASVARRVLSAPAALVALAAFAVAGPLLEHGNELKPYALDVAIALGITHAAFGALDRRVGAVRGTSYALGGAALVGCSFPAIFVLGGAAVVLLARVLHRRDGAAARRIAGLSTTWALAFLALWFVSIRAAAGNDYLVEFWRKARAPWPFSPSAVGWYVTTFFDVFHEPAGFIQAGLAAAAAIVGIHVVGRRSLSALGILGLPVLLALAASRLGGYPFSGRLILFLAPVAILLACAGLDELRRIPGRPVWFVVGSLVLLLQPAAAALSAARTPVGREEIRTVLERTVPRMRAGDGVWVYEYARPQLAWYARRGLALPAGTRVLRGAVLASDVGQDGGTRRFTSPVTLDEALATAKAQSPGPRRIWAVFSHVITWKGTDEERLARLAFERAGFVASAAPDAAVETGASATLYVGPAKPAR